MANGIGFENAPDESLPGSPYSPSDDEIREIVSLCAAIDHMAARAYQQIAASIEANDLRAFWTGMAEEEQQHAALWEHVLALSGTFRFPPIFDDAACERASLQRLDEQIKATCGQWLAAGHVSDPFVLACRLELSMLHPSFARLFYFCWIHLDIDFYNTYEDHLNRFVQVLLQHGTSKPELQLLAETLQRLWQENRTLTQQATHDELTGLLNRRAFWLLARQAMYFAERNGTPLGVLMIDVDDFRLINEQHGHPGGDRVLKGIADIVQKRLRKSDIVGRYGGEEFIVVCPNTECPAISHLAELIRQRIELATKQTIPVTVSIGAVGGRVPAGSPEADLLTLIARADQCLYQAKRTGKNRVYAQPL